MLGRGVKTEGCEKPICSVRLQHRARNDIAKQDGAEFSVLSTVIVTNLYLWNSSGVSQSLSAMQAGLYFRLFQITKLCYGCRGSSVAVCAEEVVGLFRIISAS